MTKVIDLTKEAKEEKGLKPIEFVKYISTHGNQVYTCAKPADFGNVELICKKYGGLYDLMFAFDGERSSGSLYLGHFNDGIV